MIKKVNFCEDYIECELEEVLSILNTKKTGIEVGTEEQLLSVYIKNPTILDRLSFQKIDQAIFNAKEAMLEMQMKNIRPDLINNKTAEEKNEEKRLEEERKKEQMEKTPMEILESFFNELAMYAPKQLAIIADTVWNELIRKKIYTADGIKDRNGSDFNNIDFNSSFKEPIKSINLENSIKANVVCQYLVFLKGCFVSLAQIIHTHQMMFKKK